MSDLPAVLFAPVLRAEGWTSIDLQQKNILDALRGRDRSPRVAVLQLPEAVAYFPFGKPAVRDLLYPRLIRRAAAAIGPCVLHVTDHSYGHLCTAHQPGVVNCNDLHHYVEPDLDPGYLRRWKQRVDGMRRADKILAISAHLASEVRDHLGLAADRVAALPGGVDHGEFRPLPLEEASARLPRVAALRADHLLILNIGSNLRRKNLPTLLRAIAVLAQNGGVPVKLLKVGPTLRHGEHESLIQELHLADAIVDLGHCPPPQVAAACRLAHVLSFPSLYEGFGRPTLEAQACALPCVLADSSCMREIGGTGALYHMPTDHEQLAGHLLTAAQDATTRTRLIAAGTANAAAFTWSRYADQLASIYRDVAR
ncbi:MAG: glycosyltransferase family 1 protein [Verrucomicrobia bacterium]|nr:glycosyltransferase family 1 protein [Verrucomicrobiota bacterium]